MISKGALNKVVFYILNLFKKKPTPHKVKQRILIRYNKRFDFSTLIETGTYYGEMVEAMIPHFDKIISIELDESLFKLAKKKFKDNLIVEIVLGDSAVNLQEILNNINAPCMFWLDGHYSGPGTAKGYKDSPIMDEIEIISKRNALDLVLIDDARLFVGLNGYPTLKNFRKTVKKLFPYHELRVSHDIIRIIPK